MTADSDKHDFATTDTVSVFFYAVKNTLAMSRLLIAFSVAKIFMEKINEVNMKNTSPHYMFVFRRGMVLKETDKLCGLLKIVEGAPLPYDTITAAMVEVKKWCRSMNTL